MRLASRTPIRKSDLPMLRNIVAWLRDLNQADFASIEALAVRRDMITFLKYIKANRPKGTQSTGNLPLKAVREICAQFAQPPILDEKVGDKVYKLRSEEDVWPLYFLHCIANTGGLVIGGQGRCWDLTPAGEVLLELPAPVQLGYMLTVWWHQEDWRISYPVEGLRHGLPRGFKEICLRRLLELPLDHFVSFKTFADRLIEETRLTWPSPDQSFVKDILRHVIERLVVVPLTDFGLLQGAYEPSRVLGLPYKDLTEIKLTSIGKGLLQVLK